MKYIFLYNIYIYLTDSEIKVKWGKDMKLKLAAGCVPTSINWGQRQIYNLGHPWCLAPITHDGFAARFNFLLVDCKTNPLSDVDPTAPTNGVPSLPTFICRKTEKVPRSAPPAACGTHTCTHGGGWNRALFRRVREYGTNWSSTHQWCCFYYFLISLS